MKKIIGSILLLGILCLVGCSKEDPQTVTFSEEEIVFEHNSNDRIVVNITANCPWTLSKDSPLLTIDVASGEQNSSVGISLSANDSFEERKYNLIITSSDGSSKDSLKITHKPKPGFITKDDLSYPAEGGDFDLKTETNIESLEYTLPSWIKLVPSRAMIEKSFVLSIDPNKTGKPRSGKLMFLDKNNKETAFSFPVYQDSYAPAKITLEKFPSFVVGKSANFWTNIFLEPEYADIEKLKIKHSEGCQITVSNFGGFNLSFHLTQYGLHPITFYTDKDTLLETSIELLPYNPFENLGSGEVFLGQKDDIVDWIYYSPLYELKTSDFSVVRVVNNNRFEAVGLGTSKISASVPNTHVFAEKYITVERFVLSAQPETLEQQSDGSYNTRFAIKIKGPDDMILSTLSIHAPNGDAVYQYRKDEVKPEKGEYIIKTPVYNIDFNRAEHESVNSFLGTYYIKSEVEINGSKYLRTVHVKENNMSSL